MPRRAAGSGGGDPELSLRQGLRELLDKIDRQSGGDTDGARGRSLGRQQGSRGTTAQRTRGGSGGAALGGERRPQMGDWSCQKCGFQPNFSRRRNCFGCGRPRSPRGDGGGGTRGSGGGLSSGPIGAGGLRPLLGRGLGSANGATAARGEQQSPTFRVPGSSVAARAAATAPAGGGNGNASNNSTGIVGTQGRAPQRGGGGAANGAQSTVNAGAMVDEDGFRMVPPRRGWRNARMEAKREADGGPTDVDDEMDGGAGGAAGKDPADDADDDHDDADETKPTTAQLHQAWHDEMGVVKRLRQQGLAADHPAMEAACKARDDAERAWRDTKDPTPPSLRLSRAQAKLDRAISMQAESRQAITDLEKSHQAQLAVLQARHDENTERVTMRRRQLEDVQDEVGSGGTGNKARAAQGDAVRQVHKAICSTVAPTITALIEQLDTSTPAWTALNGLLGTLADSKLLLEKAIPAAAAVQNFDIGDGEGTGTNGRDHEECGGSEWSESHELRDEGAGAGHHEAGEHDGPEAASRGRSWRRDDDMDTTEWWGGDWGAGVRWEACGHGKWARTRWADSWEAEHKDGGAEDSQPPAARRRLEPAAPGATTMEEGATAADDGTGATDCRRQQHAERVQRIVLAAINAGVQPVTAAGDELIMLDSDQLDAWAAENLPRDRDAPFW